MRWDEEPFVAASDRRLAAGSGLGAIPALANDMLLLEGSKEKNKIQLSIQQCPAQELRTLRREPTSQESLSIKWSTLGPCSMSPLLYLLLLLLESPGHPAMMEVDDTAQHSTGLQAARKYLPHFHPWLGRNCSHCSLSPYLPVPMNAAAAADQRSQAARQARLFLWKSTPTMT